MNKYLSVVDWIKQNYDVGLTTEAFYTEDMYNRFLSETDSDSNYASYQRLVRKYIKELNRNVVNNNSNGEEEQLYTKETEEGVVYDMRSYHIKTPEQLIEYAEINLEEWEVYQKEVRASQNAGNPWYIVQIKLRRKNPSNITPEDYSKRFRELLKCYEPKKYMVPQLTKKQKKITEICVFDHHFGQLSWKEETGESYDVKIASKILNDCIDYFIEKTCDETAEYILPIGNDFFNSDNPLNQTYSGTPQVEDTRWQHTIVTAEQLWIEQIDKLNSIAPVRIIVVPGNHDTTRTFYLGEFLRAWYRNNKSVSVDNSPKQRKYIKIGNTLIGYTHGNKEVKGSLPALMPQEEPLLFYQSKYWEWHLGHLHGLQERNTRLSKENFGVQEIILPSLVYLDDWHKGKGYKHLSQSMARIYDKKTGLDTVTYYRV